MKTITICSLFLLFCFAAGCQPTSGQGNLRSFEVQGDVKTVTYTTYIMEEELPTPDDLENPPLYTLVCNFNRDKECVEEIYTTRNPSANTVRKNEFKDGKWMKQMLYNDKGEVTDIYTCYYTSSDTARIKVENTKGEITDEGELIYDNGYLKATTYKKYKYEFVLNKDGNKVAYRLENLGAVITATVEYLEYDHKGNWTKKVERTKDGSHRYNYYSERTIDYYNE